MAKVATSPLAEAGRYIAAEIAQRLEANGEIKIPEITDSAVEHFLNDRAWLRRAIAELLRPLVYDTAQRKVAKTRGHIVLRDEVVTQEAFRERVRKSPRWGAWIERVGDSHKRLFDMTRPELELAAAERESRGGVEFKTAALWRRLASQLNEGQRVSDAYEEAEITQIAESLTVTVAVSIG